MNALSLPLLLPLAPRVLLADDQPLFRDALRRAITELSPAAEVEEVGDLAALLELLKQSGIPHLILLDLDMRDSRGFSGLAQIHAVQPQVAVAAVSASEDLQLVARALAHGARGFIPKSVSRHEILIALHCLLAGHCWTPESGAELPPPIEVDPAELRAAERLSQLTPQQFRIAALLADGLLNKQIAHELAISENTVKVHVSTILQRLHLSNRTQVAVLVESLHTLQPDAWSQAS